MNKVTIKGWVARDYDGDIYFYFGKPKRGKSFWIGVYRCPLIFSNFPEITWRGEPVEKTLTIE